MDAQNDNNSKYRFKIISHDLTQCLILMTEQYRIAAR